MKKIDTVLTGKIYEMKRNYPVVREFEQRMDTDKKELNKDVPKRK